MKDFFDKQLIGFARASNVWSAMLAWMLMAVGIVLFVDKQSRSVRESALYGAIFGLVLYGVFDFTNYAIFENYTLMMVVVDIAWGIFLMSVTATLLKFFYNKIN